jgi:hypothetical protein
MPGAALGGARRCDSEPQAPDVGYVEQDVDGFSGPHHDGVLPGEVGLGDAVAAQDQEPARAVDVEGMVHRVVGGHLVE